MANFFSAVENGERRAGRPSPVDKPIGSLQRPTPPSDSGAGPRGPRDMAPWFQRGNSFPSFRGLLRLIGNAEAARLGAGAGTAQRARTSGRSRSVAMPFGDQAGPQRQDRARFTRKRGSVHGVCVSLSPPCANRLARPLTGRHDASIADLNPTAPAKRTSAPAQRRGRHAAT